MKLSLEIPTAHLQQFDEYQDFYFLIEPWLRDKNYLDYHHMGKKKIYLDNGVNEYGKPTDFPTMAASSRWLNVDAVVAPDDPNNFEEHLISLEALKNSPIKSIGVLCESYRKYWYDIIRIADIVAVPYDVEDDRIQLCSMIPAEKPIHFLGFRSLTELKYADRVDSIDTGIPIKLALEGIKIENYTQRHTNRRDLVTSTDYNNITLTENEYELAVQNVRQLQMVCHR